MKKLSEYRDEEALDILADILEPCVEIFADKNIRTTYREKGKLKAVTVAIKSHKKEVVEVMARLNGVEVDEFHYNIITLPKMILEVLNDKDLLDFFKQQGENDAETLSGSVTEIIKVEPDTSSST